MLNVTKEQAALWRTGTPKQLLADLKPGGWAWGHSKLWPKYLRLHKTDLIRDIRNLPPNHVCTWRIHGNPETTGQYGQDRRTVLIWLGE